MMVLVATSPIIVQLRIFKVRDGIPSRIRRYKARTDNLTNPRVLL